MLRGNAPATIDDKGRLKIPTVFRAEIEVTWGSDFYVTSVTGDSVLVYPLPVWHEYEQKLAKLPSMNSAKKKFLNRTNFYGQLTTMDKSGRILIPAILRESARMTGEVAVLGNLSNLEIWNHERFVSSIKEDGFSESDMESLGLLGI